MSLIDELKVRGATFRVTEEALYAEALREVEAGQRRDGLWAKALAECTMDVQRAQALYLKLRVQSLKDEVAVVEQYLKQSSSAIQSNGSSDLQRPKPRNSGLTSLKKEVDYQLNGTSELGNAFAKWLGLLLLALVLVGFIGIIFG